MYAQASKENKYKNYKITFVVLNRVIATTRFKGTFLEAKDYAYQYMQDKHLAANNFIIS
jgi:hypothetical protein